MSQVDVLIVTALKEEYEAARDVALAAPFASQLESPWQEQDAKKATPYLLARFRLPGGTPLRIALARPTRMGGPATAPIVASLVERLKPRCLAMSGVCAGNPGDLGLGDVVVAEMVYQYDEGKVKREAIEADHRQIPMLDSLVRAAQNLDPAELPSHGSATAREAQNWLLERLYAGDDPRTHPGRARYFPGATWKSRVAGLEKKGLIRRDGLKLVLEAPGRGFVEKTLFEDVTGPRKLPFDVKVGPIASGNVVVKDGMTWDKLKQWGVRSVLGLEMEAATIGSIAHRLEVPMWIVAKGVMDHADPRKDDRYKPFAARASAEVLYRLLFDALDSSEPEGRGDSPGLVKSVFVIGGETGETDHPDFEPEELKEICRNLGGAIARAGAELIVCSPFPDSADMHSVLGYVRAAVGGSVQFHSPRHADVEKARSGLEAMLGSHDARFMTFEYPGPEDEDEDEEKNKDSWSQAWLLCQLQALEIAQVVVAIGGRVSKTANTLLHLAEGRRIPVVPFAFLGGASRRYFERRNWAELNPDIDPQTFRDKSKIGEAMKIAEKLLTDRLCGAGTTGGPLRVLFISRARANAAFADALVPRLKEVGVATLLGENEIRSNRMAQPSIEEAILRAQVCIVLWSRDFALSRWCSDELDLALQREQAGAMHVWLYNLDGSEIVPRSARQLPQVVTRTPQRLVQSVLSRLGTGSQPASSAQG